MEKLDLISSVFTVVSPLIERSAVEDVRFNSLDLEEKLEALRLLCKYALQLCLKLQIQEY